MSIQIEIENLDIPMEMRQILLALEHLPKTECCTQLSRIYRNAWYFQSLQSKRHGKAYERAIRWGEEYHTFLQKHLAAGLRLKTAKTAARRDFIAAHPRPKNADELIRTDDFPGLTTPSLRYYHKAYMDSLQVK